MARIISKHANNQDDWEASSYILAKGEIGVAVDTGAWRAGNGVDVWVDLPTITNNVESVAGKTGPVILEKSDIGEPGTPTGLDQVDNTADLNKPMSTQVAVAIADLSEQIADVVETGGATKETVGLGNVDNTSDLNKPISTATQIALNTKATVNNPIFTGNVQGISKSMIGLAQVDNTSDTSKPISTATQTALNNKVSTSDGRLSNTRTPTDGSVVNSSVSSSAAISLDKTADTATRVAMTPSERTAVAEAAGTFGSLHAGMVGAGVGVLEGLTTPPDHASIAAIGENAMHTATSITSSVGVGVGAMSEGQVLNRQIAFGDDSLKMVGTSSSNRGADNIALGINSGRFLTTADSTISMGVNSGMGRNASGDINIGKYTGSAFTIRGLSGDWEQHSPTHNGVGTFNNVAIGGNALKLNAGSQNLAIGTDALAAITDGNGNIAVGSSALTNLGLYRGPSGQAKTYVNKSGSYTWNDDTLTLGITAHDVNVGDYVQIRLTGGTFSASAVVSDNSVRGLVDQIINADSFTIKYWTTDEPIQSLNDVGTARLVYYERDEYTKTEANNIGIGTNSGVGLASGSNNILIGNNSGPNVVSELDDTFIIGTASGNVLTGGSGVVFVGNNVGSTVASATNVTLLGNGADGIETSADSVGIGSDVTVNGVDATAIGASAAVGENGVSVGSGATGLDNAISIGKNSSAALSSVAIGLSSTVTGEASVALGNGSTASYNATAVGSDASAGDYGLAFGSGASGAGNGIAIGHGVSASDGEARFADETYNTVISGATATIVAPSINIGTQAGTTSVNIGNGATATNIGSSNTSGSIILKAQLVTIDDAGVTSDARDKSDVRDTSLGLNFINKVRPVEYRWAKRGEEEGVRFHQGVIAQEVKVVSDELGVDFGGFVDQSHNGGEDQMTIRYNELIGPLIKSIQELSARVEELEKNNG